jgi:predicted PurR-regulated permease PerM
MTDVSLVTPRPQVPVASAQTPGPSGLMTLASVVVVVVGLSVARDVLIPVTLAVLLSFLLAPIVELLRRARLGRMPSVLLAVILAIGVILGVGGMIGAQVADLAGDLPRYASTVRNKVQSVEGATIGRASDLINHLTSPLDHLRVSVQHAQPSGAVSSAADPADAAAPPPEKPVPVEVHQPASPPMQIARRILSPAISPLATTGIVFVVAIFILLQQDDLRDRLIRLFGARDLLRTITAMDEAAHRLSRYFLTLLALNAGFGCVVAAGLVLIGVPKPAVWGILAALMRFVPYFGAFLSAALPLALAAAVDPGWSMAAWTAALFLVGETIMGQFVEPLVYGNSTGLSPLSAVIAAIFWGWLWGGIGLILSMPLTLCVVVLSRHVDRLQFLNVLLGDQPALTPIETFYHRMVAGNVDDVLDYAEEVLKDHSLASYYDEVAIPGLQLAAADVERGVLSAAQTDRILDGIEDLLAELTDHIDQDAPAQSVLPPWRAPAAVLCIAGRGPLGGTTSAMLTQVLGKHGIGAQAAPHSLVGPRASLNAADLSGVLMVCLSSGGAGRTPSYLRYRVRRLRERIPDATIVVGLWSDQVVADERLRVAIGADRCVKSLREALAVCLDCASAMPADVVASPLVPRSSPSSEAFRAATPDVPA